VAKQIFKSVASEFKKIGMSQSLPDDVASTLASGAPREILKICRELVAAVVADGRRVVRTQDLTKILHESLFSEIWSKVDRVVKESTDQIVWH
jgi:hypothetical protein